MRHNGLSFDSQYVKNHIHVALWLEKTPYKKTNLLVPQDFSSTSHFIPAL